MPRNHTINFKSFEEKLEKFQEEFNSTDNPCIAYALLSVMVLLFEKEANLIRSKLIPMYEKSLIEKYR